VRRAGSLIQASCWLALLLIVAKACSWTEAWEEDGVAGGLMTLVMASWTDVLFALGWGALGEGVVWLVRRHLRMAAILRGIFIGLLTVFAVYGIVGVGVFHYFMRPLTFELLTMVGNAATVRSSIAERITWPFTVVFFVLPPLFVFLAASVPTSRRVIAPRWRLQRSGWRSATRGSRKAGPTKPATTSGATHTRS
jgi:uncharacterized membrane protein (Fun14 family)